MLAVFFQSKSLSPMLFIISIHWAYLLLDLQTIKTSWHLPWMTTSTSHTVCRCFLSQHHSCKRFETLGQQDHAGPVQDQQCLESALKRMHQELRKLQQIFFKRILLLGKS
jgi:hypothetical protein